VFATCAILTLVIVDFMHRRMSSQLQFLPMHGFQVVIVIDVSYDFRPVASFLQLVQF
jgi:hypothetical protein